MSEKYSEQKLLAEIKKGNEEVFTFLYTKYSTQLYLNAFKMVKDELVAQEIVQEVFIKIWSKRDSLQIHSSISAYVFRMAQNGVFDFFRKLERDRALLTRFKEAATVNYFHVEEDIMSKEQKELLQKAIETLPPQQKRVYQHCIIEGCTYKDAAGKMQIGHHTVKEYLSKARQSIRIFLEKNKDNPYALLLWLLMDLPG